MLRSNLSTRPFYNERAVHLVLGALALVVLALTAVNLYEIVQLSRQNTGLAARIDRDRNEAARLTREAARIRRGIDQDELQLVVNAAREANTIIDQRTFSWTALFNALEQTLPPDVMLTAVQPSFNDEGTRVSLTVVGKQLADVDEFMEKLEATGAFETVQDRQMEQLEGGLLRVVVDSRYVPEAAEPETAVKEETTKPEASQKPNAPTTDAPPKTAAALKPAGERR